MFDAASRGGTRTNRGGYLEGSLCSGTRSDVYMYNTRVDPQMHQTPGCTTFISVTAEELQNLFAHDLADCFNTY